VKRILNEMDVAFNDGTPEGKETALSLRPALDEAQKKAKDANELYASMRDASLVNDSMARLFTTPPDPGQKEHDGARAPSDAEPKVIQRADFDALNPAARMTFMKSGGRVED